MMFPDQHWTYLLVTFHRAAYHEFLLCWDEQRVYIPHLLHHVKYQNRGALCAQAAINRFKILIGQLRFGGSERVKPVPEAPVTASIDFAQNHCISAALDLLLLMMILAGKC